MSRPQMVWIVAAIAVLAISFGVLRNGSDEGLSGVPIVRPEVPVTAMDAGTEVANNSPALVADPSDERFVVMTNRLDSPDFGCSLQVTGDGGRSWTTAEPVPELPLGADKCYAPEAVFDGDGVLYYLFVGLEGTGNQPMGAFLTKSDDRAQSFSPPRQVLGPLNFGVRMAIDSRHGARGRIHLVWLHASSDPPLGGFGPPPNPIMAAHSDDGGRSFSRPVQVSDEVRNRVAAPVLAVAPNGTVHVGYFDLEEDVRDYQGLEGPVWEGTWSLVVATSASEGRHFGEGVVVDDQVVPFERVMLIFTMAPASLVASGDRVCAAWSDARRGDADVFLRCSETGGRTWGGPHRLNDDPVGNGRVQYLPRLSISGNGRIDAIFYDRRSDPKNVLNEVFYTYSTDGGKRFNRNMRITRDSFESRIGQRYVHAAAVGLTDFGSRLALLSGRNSVLTAWTDTRNSTLLLGRTGQDIFSASVHQVPPGTPRSDLMIHLILIGLALGLVAVAAAAVGTRRRKERATSDAATFEPEGRAARPRLRRSIWVATAVAAIAAPILLRSRSTGPPPNYLPSPAPTVLVTMREQAFEHRRIIPSGRVVFRVPNAGSLVHRLVLVPLQEGLPSIQELIQDQEATVVAPFAAVRPQPPGGTGTFAVDLESGTRYAMVCLVRDVDGKTHAEKGMLSEFRAGANTPRSDSRKVQ